MYPSVAVRPFARPECEAATETYLSERLSNASMMIVAFAEFLFWRAVAMSQLRGFMSLVPSGELDRSSYHVVATCDKQHVSGDLRWSPELCPMLPVNVE